jgi:hypothetical protein
MIEGDDYDFSNLKRRDDPRWLRKLELLEKQKTGDITSAELDELANLEADESRSDELISLRERVATGDESVRSIWMNEGDIMELNADGEEVVLFTEGLNGCFATAVVVERDDGTKAAFLTHFPSVNIQDNSSLIAQFSQRALKGNVYRVSCLIAGPGQYVKENDQWSFVIYDENGLDKLIASLQESLGDQISLQQHPYNQKRELGKKDVGSLIVRVAHDSNTFKLGDLSGLL